LNILITIVARKGSKRLPGKNIKNFCEKPLMRWTLEQAEDFVDYRLSDTVDTVICSDIDKELLLKICWGRYILGRPEELNGDKVPKLAVIRYATEKAEEHYKIKYDAVIDLDVTSPLRKPDDIANALKLFKEKKPPTLFSVTKARRLPWFNQVVSGFIGNDQRCVQPSGYNHSWPYYDLNASIYIYDRGWSDYKLDSPISYRSEIYLMEDWQATDIDTQNDFDIAEFLFRKHILEGL